MKFGLIFFVTHLILLKKRIHCGSGNTPIWGQYTILDIHGVNNTGSLWILYVQSHIFQGVPLDWFNSQTTTLCVIGKIISGVDRMVRAYLG